MWTLRHKIFTNVLFEVDQTRLVQCERGRVAELLDRDVDELKHPRGQAGRGPTGKPQRCEATMLEGGAWAPREEP
jgi:hypothetical protein